MQSFYPERFEREMGCTLADWLRWLPGGSGGHPLLQGEGHARVDLPDGRLELTWQVLPPRRIGLATLPRLHVTFDFNTLPEPARHAFMRYFDLYTQRGGG